MRTPKPTRPPQVSNGKTLSSKATAEEEGKESVRSGAKVVQRSARGLLSLLVAGVAYVLLLVLLLPRAEHEVMKLTLGRPSPIKLVAPRDFKLPDREKTLAAREKAALQAVPVLDEIPSVADGATRQVNLLFEKAQSIRTTPGLSSDEQQERLADATGLSVGEHREVLKGLLEYSNYDLLRKSLTQDLNQIYANDIVSSAEDLALVRRHLQEGIDVVDARGEMARRPGVRIKSILDVESARQQLRRQLAKQFTKPDEDRAPRELGVALGDLVIGPSLEISETRWNKRRSALMKKVPDIEIEIQRDQRLLDVGDIVHDRIRIDSPDGSQVMVNTETLLDELQRSGGSLSWNQAVARSLLILIPVVLLGFYTRRFHASTWKDLTRVTSLFALVVLVVSIGKLLSYLSLSLGPAWEYLGYAMPVALAGMLITILLDTHLALFTVIVLALFSAVLFGDLDFFWVNLIGGLVSIFTVSRVRRRIDVTWAGLKVALAASAVATLLYLWRIDHLGELVQNYHPWILVLIWASLHGILAIMLAGLLLPLLESVMGVVTDIQLLELSQKNSLLKRLESEAPGTYQHSMNVANLAESAAEAIGANGLLARVASLYHDIGKLNKPNYFTENQVIEPEKKTHDRLAPSMSRLLICNHIKDGMEMAEKEGLPEGIRNAIAQHHGTTLLRYFYDKALKSNQKEVVNEEDYRYPGPKPQTVEMAIIMLADSLEAASRSLPPGMAKGELFQFVRGIINQKFMDNQFEDSDLTLSDLHRLAEAFTRSLISLTHRRIAYPSVHVPERLEKPMTPPPEEKQTPVGAGAVNE